MAVYGVMRSEDPFYYKLKTGLLKKEISHSIIGDDSETRLSLGAGLGVRFDNSINIEAEYTIVDADSDLLSIGLTYNF